MSFLYALSGVLLGVQSSSKVLTKALGPLLVFANLISAFINQGKETRDFSRGRNCPFTSFLLDNLLQALIAAIFLNVTPLEIRVPSSFLRVKLPDARRPETKHSCPSCCSGPGCCLPFLMPSKPDTKLRFSVIQQPILPVTASHLAKGFMISQNIA